MRFVPIAARDAPRLAALGAARFVLPSSHERTDLAANPAGAADTANPARPVTDMLPRGDGDDGVILRVDGTPAVTYRRSGDDNILVEYGEIVLDLGLRARVHALYLALVDAALNLPPLAAG